MIEGWRISRCVVCGTLFDFPKLDFYRPKTCTNKDCALKFAHHPERYITFQDHLDKCRMGAFNG